MTNYVFHPSTSSAPQVDLAELTRVLQTENRGTELTKAEVAEFVADLEPGVISALNSGGKVLLSELRSHPCYQ